MTSRSELPLRQRLARIAPFFSGTRTGFILAIIGSVVAASTEPLVPALLRIVLDKGWKDSSFPVWMVPAAIIGLTALRGLAGFIANYGLSWAANRGVIAIRTSMFDRILDAHPSLFTSQSASSLINAVTYQVQNAATQIVYSLQGLVRDSLTLVALVGYLLYLNWRLTLFVAVLFPAVGFVMRIASRRLRRLTLQAQRATDELAYVVEENVLAWRIVRLHAAGPSQRARFTAVNDALRRLNMKAVIANSTMTPATQLLAASAIAAVIAAALLQSGGTVGSFVAFITAMLMLVTPIKHLSEVAGPLTSNLAILDRSIGLAEDTPVEKGGNFVSTRVKGHVRLDGVSLRYRDDQAPALDSVTLELRPGETVALVGPSGAGKSTLVNVLPRFLDPSSGSVSLDGVPIERWNIDALRRHFALVSQDVVLFNDTVAANVALGDTIDRDRVREALAAANLLNFVDSLPKGIDTQIGHNGSELSGGQRQRLAIARAVYKDASILILDEATSALDSASERLVQSALDKLMRDRTSLVIAHRLSTIERADRIVAMESGRIVEQGTHDELLRHGGLYAHLHAMQFRS